MTDRIDEDASREAFEKWYTSYCVNPLNCGHAKEALIVWQARGEYEAARIRSLLGSSETGEAVAEVCANGWDYGTHPKDKATIILDTIKRIVEGE